MIVFFVSSVIEPNPCALPNKRINDKTEGGKKPNKGNGR